MGLQNGTCCMFSKQLNRCFSVIFFAFLPKKIFTQVDYGSNNHTRRPTQNFVYPHQIVRIAAVLILQFLSRFQQKVQIYVNSERIAFVALKSLTGLEKRSEVYQNRRNENPAPAKRLDQARKQRMNWRKTFADTAHSVCSNEKAYHKQALFS